MQHFTAPDGARIAYRDEGLGRPLVLLHGLMAHGGFFADQSALAERFRLISIDFRGHGASAACDPEITLAQLAGDVAALVQALEIEDAIGIGWSLGASVLWRVLAGASGVRFAGAVVVDMTPRVLNRDDWNLGLSRETCDARTAAMRDDFADFATNAGHAIFAQPVADGFLEKSAWAGGEFAASNRSAVAALWASLMEDDLRSLLPRIVQPTLVVHGAQSQLYGPGTADHVAASLPNARTLRFDRSGHAPHMEEPELFNRAIEDFAASLPRVRQHQTIA